MRNFDILPTLYLYTTKSIVTDDIVVFFGSKGTDVCLLQ